MNPGARSHPWVLWTIALLAMVAFARLGVWQLSRADEKRAMLAKAAHALAARTPRPIAVASDEARRSDYDWVSVHGRYADAPAVLLDNQQRDGRAGVRAYRLFLSDEGTPLLVELGWLPLPPERKLPRIARDSGERTLSGLLLPPPGEGLAIGAPMAPSGGALLATRLDIPALRVALKAPKLAPRVVRLPPDDASGYLRDFDILPNTLPPERHLGYAVQWFALSTAVLVAALLLTWRAKRATRIAS